MKKAVGMIVSLGFLATLALAQGKPDPLEACYQQPDGAPRLACFNKEMQRRQATTSSGTLATTSGAAATPAAVATVKQPAVDTVGLQGSALRKKLAAEGIKVAPLQPIVARVIRVVSRPHSIEAFVLDNGQTWEQTESMSNLDVRLQDTVTIKPGILDAFFLNTPRSQRVRVHRIL